jgi:ribosomal protein L23
MTLSLFKSLIKKYWKNKYHFSLESSANLPSITRRFHAEFALNSNSITNLLTRPLVSRHSAVVCWLTAYH